MVIHTLSKGTIACIGMRSFYASCLVVDADLEILESCIVDWADNSFIDLTQNIAVMRESTSANHSYPKCNNQAIQFTVNGRNRPRYVFGKAYAR